jgi:hypothetical protein
MYSARAVRGSTTSSPRDAFQIFVHDYTCIHLSASTLVMSRQKTHTLDITSTHPIRNGLRRKLPPSGVELALVGRGNASASQVRRVSCDVGRAAVTGRREGRATALHNATAWPAGKHTMASLRLAMARRRLGRGQASYRGGDCRGSSRVTRMPTSRGWLVPRAART